jgi:hypothetical protein
VTLAQQKDRDDDEHARGREVADAEDDDERWRRGEKRKKKKSDNRTQQNNLRMVHFAIRSSFNTSILNYGGIISDSLKI